MEKDLSQMTFTELIGVKSSQINRDDMLLATQAVDRVLRLRVNEFRGYLDRYDQLTPEQKEMSEPCLRYRMAMGPANYIVRKCVEVQDGTVSD